MLVQPNVPPDRLFDAIKRAVRGPVHAIMDQIYGDATARPAEHDVLQYVDVLEYAAARRAEDPLILATLLRREPGPDAWLVTQVFTGASDELIRTRNGLVGRQLLVKTLDEELAELFGEAESIVVELP